jgi:hypothetical protein
VITTESSAVRENAAIKLLLPVVDVATGEAIVLASGGIALARPWGSNDYADPEGNVFGLVAGGQP